MSTQDQPVFPLHKHLGLEKNKTLEGFGAPEKFSTPKEEKKYQNAQTKAVVMMNVYCLANTAQSCIWKMMTENNTADLMEYTLFRSLTIMALAGFVLWWQNRNPYEDGIALDEETRKIMLWRAILGYCTTLFINASLQMISFSLLVIIYQTAPFWMTYLSYRINGEPIYKLEALAMVLCFIGVFFIVSSEEPKQNELLLGNTERVDSERLEQIANSQNLLLKVGGIVLTFAASWMSAGVGVFNRSLKHVPFSVVLFYGAFFGVAVTFLYLFVAVLLFNRPLYFLDFAPIDNSFLFMATGFGAIGIMSQTIAYQSGNSGFVALFSFLNVIYALVADLFIFQEPINKTQVIASLAIVGICLGIGLEKIRLSNLKKNLARTTDINELAKL